MPAFLICSGVLALCVAAWVATVIRSDIQLILLATCAIGGLLLIGLGALIHDVGRLKIERRQSEDPYGDPQA